MFDEPRADQPADQLASAGPIQLIHISPLFSSIADRPDYDGPPAASALANVVRLVPGLTHRPFRPATIESAQAA